MRAPARARASTHARARSHARAWAPFVRTLTADTPLVARAMLRALCRGCGSCVCGLSCRAAFVLKAVAGTAQEPAAARALEAQGAQGNATGLAAEDVLLALPLHEAGRIEERLDRACNQGHARTLSSLLQDGLSRWIRALGRNNVLCVKLDDVIRYDAASSCLRAPMPAMCNAQRPCTGVARPERAGQCRLLPIMSLPRTPLLYGNYSTACLVLTIESPLPSPPPPTPSTSFSLSVTEMLRAPTRTFLSGSDNLMQRPQSRDSWQNRRSTGTRRLGLPLAAWQSASSTSSSHGCARRFLQVGRSGSTRYAPAWVAPGGSACA